MAYRRTIPPIYTAESAVRPPDWRWLRVMQAVRTGGYVTIEGDGETICRTVRYVRKLNRICAEWAVRRLAKADPDIFLAMKLMHEDSLRPLELKARVLARQSDEAVARHLGTLDSAVSLYVELCFDVRDRIDARSWISAVARAMDIRRPPDAMSLMLQAAYRHGPAVVDPWLDYLAHQGESHDLATDLGRQRASIDLLIEAHSLELDTSSRQKMATHLDLIAAIRPKSSKSPTVAAAVARTTARLTSHIAWNPGLESAKSKPDIRLATGPEPISYQSGEFARAG